MKVRFCSSRIAGLIVRELKCTEEQQFLIILCSLTTDSRSPLWDSLMNSVRWCQGAGLQLGQTVSYTGRKTGFRPSWSLTSWLDSCSISYRVRRTSLFGRRAPSQEWKGFTIGVPKQFRTRHNGTIKHLPPHPITP